MPGIHTKINWLIVKWQQNRHSPLFNALHLRAGNFKNLIIGNNLIMAICDTPTRGNEKSFPCGKIAPLFGTTFWGELWVKNISLALSSSNENTSIMSKLPIKSYVSIKAHTPHIQHFLSRTDAVFEVYNFPYMQPKLSLLFKLLTSQLQNSTLNIVIKGIHLHWNSKTIN